MRGACGHALSRSSERSATGHRAGRERPGQQETKVAAPTRGKQECSIRSARPRGSSTRRSAGTGSASRSASSIIGVGRGRALSHAARHRRSRDVVVALKATEPQRHHARRAVRRGRLFHAHLLRPVRAAHDRREPRAVPRRGARRLHQLFGRPQCRRQRVHRRRGALPRLFGLGADRDRRREDLLHRGAHLLARQCHRARARHRLRAAGGERDRPAAAVVQPRARARALARARRLCRLGVGQAARHRPRRLDRDACRAGR